MDLSDTEFQNLPDTLRIAPWLDMSLLRKALQDALRENMNEGQFQWTHNEFKEDIKAFYEGRCGRAPRSSMVTDMLTMTIANIFPEHMGAREKKIRAIKKIAEHLLQQDSWHRTHNRSILIEDEASETPSIPF